MCSLTVRYYSIERLLYLTNFVWKEAVSPITSMPFHISLSAIDKLSSQKYRARNQALFLLKTLFFSATNSAAEKVSWRPNGAEVSAPVCHKSVCGFKLGGRRCSHSAVELGTQLLLELRKGERSGVYWPHRPVFTFTLEVTTVLDLWHAYWTLRSRASHGPMMPRAVFFFQQSP